VSSALDQIWIDCAAAIDLPIERGGDAYVHFDGRVLHLATDEHLDDDDTIAQLILHEICHLLVEGPTARHQPDWGLDNTSDADAHREAAAVRLQAHLTGAFGLRGMLFPTTDVRRFFDALPAWALGLPGGDDPSVRLAHAATERAARAPYGPALRQALSSTAAHLGMECHPKSGYPQVDHDRSDPRRCGDCAWRAPRGLCRQSTRRTFVEATAQACVRHEAHLDCQKCGACCRSAYDAVFVSSREPIVRLRPELVRSSARPLELERAGDRCAALAGPVDGPYRCEAYPLRPRTCRDFERGGRHCLDARRKVGLSL
jgi:hypothetical protein